MNDVQWFKFGNMRSLITILFLLVSIVGISQNEGLNNNSNVNTTNSIEVREVPVSQDSSYIIMEEDETLKNESRKLKKSETKDKSIEKGGARAYSNGAPALEESINAPAPSVQSSQEYKAASYEFSSTKRKASVQRSQRSPSMDQQVQMDQAVDYFEANSPNSFEYHYFKYVSGNYNVELVSHLEEAEVLRPNNTDLQVQMAAYNIIERNKDVAIDYLDKLKASGRLTTNTLHYAEDILLSAPVNGVLITHGFDDSYGVWYQQNNSKIREDVTLISLDFMQSEQYRSLLKEDGYKIPESKVVDVNFLKSFCELNSSKGLSISLTTPKEYFKPLQTKLYVTGLVFEYHKDQFDNFQRNDELWNSILKKYLIENATDEKSKQLSSNYLPMLLQLRKVYAKIEEEQKLRDVDEASDKVGVQCKKYEQVQKLKNSY